jgi:uncharacterized protein with HEPN domain
MSSNLARAALAVTAARTDIARMLLWAQGKSLNELQTDVMLRYTIERAFISIDAALRDVPTTLLVEHQVEHRLIADFRNVLAHCYEDVIDARVLGTIEHDLPAPDVQLASILAALDNR